MAEKITFDRLSVLRFPLIVCVVFIHAYETEVFFANGAAGVASPGVVTGFLRSFISHGVASVAVPLFFLMSGFFFFRGFTWSAASYLGKVRSRIRTLLVPFLFWNVLTLLVIAAVQLLPATQGYVEGRHDPVSSYGLYDYANALLGMDRLPVAYQFWFIRDLMVMVVLVPLVYLLLRSVPRIALGCAIILWYIKLWPVYVPSSDAFAFFFAGAFLAFRGVNIYALDRYSTAILSLYPVVLVMDVLTKQSGFNRFIHNAGILLGITAAVCLTGYIVQKISLKERLIELGKASFFVFAVHALLMLAVRKIVYRLVMPTSDLTVFLLYLAIPILVIMLALLLYRIMRSVTPGLLKVVSGGR